MHPSNPLLRNIAIVAHVDHGKTTLVDFMLRQAGTFHRHEQVVDRVMDSNPLERERGITILAKNTSIFWKGVKINIIDTPGHSDFGGEVERTLRMTDGALLLVDAAEGPLPQTRFVLSKCIALGFPILVVINKIDRSDARPEEVLNAIFDLFCDLHASEAQLNFPWMYAIGRKGVAKRTLEDPSETLEPLLDLMVSTIPPAPGDPEVPLQLLIHNLDHDDYLGRLGVGRLVAGTIRTNQTLKVLKAESTEQGSVKTLFTFEGLKRTPVSEAKAGEIVAIAGIDCVEVGDTLVDLSQGWEGRALTRIHVDPPTIQVAIGVNSSPLAGKCKQSKFLTGRQIQERLLRETQKNLSIQVRCLEEGSTLTLLGRGELQIAILIETMRREGYELQISNPEVVTKMIDGVLHEPYERAILEVPEDMIGLVTERISPRQGRMIHMQPYGTGRMRLEYAIPSRGLIGFRGQFLTATRGLGLLHTLFDGWEPWGGTITKRVNGAMVSDRAGVTTPYAMHHLQARGEFFLSPGMPVYEGMIVGEHNRSEDTDVNMVREKKLSNVRNHGKDENVMLAVPRVLTLESAMEWIDTDELVEVTPETIRVRKRILGVNLRPLRKRALEQTQRVE